MKCHSSCATRTWQCSLCIILLFSLQVYCIRQPLPPRVPLLPLKMPPRATPPRIQLIVYATISTMPVSTPTVIGQQKGAQQFSINTTNVTQFSHPTTAKIIRKRQKQKAKRERAKADDEAKKATAKANWTKLLMREWFGQLGEEEKQPMPTAKAITTVWQLFSLCSGAFVRIVGSRVDARKVGNEMPRGDNHIECDTLFVPEPVDDDWPGRGSIRLKHFRTGHYLCIGQWRGIVAKKHPANDANCQFREHLTQSGHSRLISRRPLGFSPAGAARTHPSNRLPLRCFQFTKLISQLEQSADFCTSRPRRARADGEEQAQLREIARQALLAKIEATDGDWNNNQPMGSQ